MKLSEVDIPSVVARVRCLRMSACTCDPTVEFTFDDQRAGVTFTHTADCEVD